MHVGRQIEVYDFAKFRQLVDQEELAL